MAETKKRVRKPKSEAMIRITVVREQTVWKSPSASLDDPNHGYTAAFPQTETRALLEQTIPEAKFDLGKVIKALNGL